MKKFKEQNPLLFYGGIFIIAILIYGKIATIQRQDVLVKSQKITYNKSIEEPQETIEPTEDENLKFNQKTLDEQNNPERGRAFRRMTKRLRREIDLMCRGGLKKDFIYKDNTPYGKVVSINYDDFFKKYHIYFYNEAANQVHFELLEGNFEFDDDFKYQTDSLWLFKYKGSIYRMVNNADSFY